MAKEDEKKGSDNSEGTGDKLLAGKFKTPEELEAGYTEAEKAMHKANEEAARAKEEAERWKAQVEGLNKGQDRNDVADPEVDIDAFREQFIANPREALVTFGKGLAAGIINEVETRQTNRDKVSKFLDKNPDISANKNLFAVSLAQVPGNLSLEDRLEKAAELTRSEINRIKEEANKTRDAEDEAHRKARVEDEGAGRDTPRKKSKKDEEADEDHSFEGYMKERNVAFGQVRGIV